MTKAGQALLEWSRSDARPIDEFGPWASVEEAIVAIEAEMEAVLQPAFARLEAVTANLEGIARRVSERYP